MKIIGAVSGENGCSGLIAMLPYSPPRADRGHHSQLERPPAGHGRPATACVIFHVIVELAWGLGRWPGTEIRRHCRYWITSSAVPARLVLPARDHRGHNGFQVACGVNFK
jgi:hypothetical protein